MTSVANKVGPASRFVHLGLTSSDVLDTALAYQLKKATELILEEAEKLISELERAGIDRKKIFLDTPETRQDKTRPCAARHRRTGTAPDRRHRTQRIQGPEAEGTAPCPRRPG